MSTVAKANCTILADLLKAYGVEDVVLCPGSRNAPVSIAVERRGFYRTHVIVDERTAAFVALGMAKMSKRPVAVAVTSGTAVLNCAPAVAEAYYARVPLIVVSADRPERWIDQRDSQTIRQAGVLTNIVRCTVNVPDTLPEARINLLLNKALQEATGDIPGPVHINMPLDKPLTALCDVDDAPQGRLTPRQRGTAVSHWQLDYLCSTIAETPKVLMIAGSGCDLSGIKISESKNVAFFADLSVNQPSAYKPTTFDGVDLGPGLVPDLIINFGGTIISDHFKSFLRRSGAPVWNIGFDDVLVDTFGGLQRQVDISARAFLEYWSDYLSKHPSDTKSSYRPDWNVVFNGSEIPSWIFGYWSDYSAMLSLADTLYYNWGCPYTLFIANGMVARYAQYPSWSGGYVLDQRGVSGIEGCTSTAAGVSMVTDTPVILLTGDMGAAYDVGALALRGLRPNFKMVVFDNCGGDIFRRVATTAALPEAGRLFVAQPKFPLAELAHAYGFRYFYAQDRATLEKQARIFMLEKQAPAILHIKVHPDNNKQIYHILFTPPTK